MAPVVSVHVADVSISRALRLLARPGQLRHTEGLLDSQIALAARLSPSAVPSPSLRRVALVAFWQHASAAERFSDEHPIAEVLADGFYALLEPLRVFGAWPGLDPAAPKGRTTEYQGPACVLTLGRLRIRRTVPFLRTSARAAGAATAAPGFLWGTALARPPFVATFSLWASTPSIAAYAYDDAGAPHMNAITTDRGNAFHKRSAFARFRPLEVKGSLQRDNSIGDEQLTIMRQGAKTPT